MNILITGGAGFIGSHLTKYFLNKSDSVTVIDNFVTGNKNNLSSKSGDLKLKIIEADITDYDFSNLPQFDIVYDLASPASPKDFVNLSVEILKANSVGLMNLLDFFIKSKSKSFVFASTSEIYGDPLEHPQCESYFGNVNSTGIRSCYDEGKRFAEAALFAYQKRFNLDIRIARIFNTYGPYMDKNDGRVISNFVNQAITNQPITIYGDGKQTRSCCYISDMVKGLVKLGTLDNLSKQVINIGSPEEKTVEEIAKLVKMLTNSDSKIEYKPIGQDDPKKRCPNINKAKRLLNWQPETNLEKGLKLTIEYFKSI